ncbi:SLATT domain-containing protein [Methanobrevibacter arboriphilus]|uniref:SLATT domain-containing protein n=1 Tax=Methanobrevibacter arboriphilus TaxID=39441 RepID=UPI000AE73D6D|nr:SLATT domain-containing protein [Methanobrevibacter arboriphilus]
MNENIYRGELEVQLKEAYGRVLYTYTSHLKFMNMLDKKHRRLKYAQIILSALSFTGFFVTIIFDKIALAFISGIVSLILLCLNLYYKEFNLPEDIKQHRMASDKLWLIREKYISLLTDINVKNIDDIVIQRDNLQQETADVYSTSPKTNSKSYKEAQKALKSEEEQFFSSGELDKMLPEHLRNK